MTALFVILPYPSHYMASFGFARMWQQRGFRVVFTGVDSLRQLVENEGFEFCEMVYAHESVILKVKIRLLIGLLLRTLLDKQSVRQRYREFYTGVLEIHQIIRQYNPDVIFLDEHLGHYALYAAPFKLPMAVLNTKLSTRKQVGVPPLNAAYIPNASFSSRFWSKWLWIRYLQRRDWRELVQRMSFMGYDERCFQQRVARQVGVDLRQFFSRDNMFYDGLCNAPTVLLAPQRLEFDGVIKSGNEYYCNPWLERDETPHLSEDYLALRDQLQHRQQTEGLRIIYAAFGTLTHTVSVKMQPFIQNVVKAITSRPDWHLVLATAGLPIDGPTLPNVSLLNYVPQLNMLTWADAMITHGGLTTVKECLFARVPMLIYPFHAKADTPGNGARITQHGWGLQGDIRHDNPADIARKLNRVLALNLPAIEPDTDLPAGLLATLFPDRLDLAESDKSISSRLIMSKS